MAKNVLMYEEYLTSPRTTAQFVALALLSLLPFAWRVTAAGLGLLSITFLCLFCLFAFYSLNYRTLIIRLMRQSLTLTFGVFCWTVPLANVAGCALDDVSTWRIGGAGIHFRWIRRRYRAMFNSLDCPRVVVALKRRRGLVRDIAFCTRGPGDVVRIITEAVTQQAAAEPRHEKATAPVGGTRSRAVPERTVRR
jgi:hypothetical protein